MDIQLELRDAIEMHFNYFWDNDRTAVLLNRKEYFDSIPFYIQEHIMTRFLFADIINITAFRSFFKIGKEFDSNFLYEIAFGFMPRKFTNTAKDRYMYDEEGDVTEIYFILKGEWAIAFNSYCKSMDNQLTLQLVDDELKGPDDMFQEGKLIAQRRSSYGYIGDYYVLSSKRSMFSYVALSQLDTFAITKQFLYNNIFVKFPGLHQDMLSESFSRYIREIRKPCDRKRNEVI
jgi:hypothetical protein